MSKFEGSYLFKTLFLQRSHEVGDGIGSFTSVTEWKLSSLWDHEYQVWRPLSGLIMMDVIFTKRGEIPVILWFAFLETCFNLQKMFQKILQINRRNVGSSPFRKKLGEWVLLSSSKSIVRLYSNDLNYLNFLLLNFFVGSIFNTLVRGLQMENSLF